ncbi:hypothetical protein AgCh_030908 [Apium graveolens]
MWEEVLFKDEEEDDEENDQDEVDPSAQKKPRVVWSIELHRKFVASVNQPGLERVYKNNGYLMVSCNGGLNQMRGAICDMVVIARYLNVTLIIPELDKSTFWEDSSEFKDIFDVNHFITSLRSEILPLLRRFKVVHLNRTDARLANNGLPIEIQKLRCRFNFNALRFTPQIEELGRKVDSILRQNGPFVVLHLRYEMDMLAFSGSSHGCNSEEFKELARMRYYMLIHGGKKKI